MLWIKDLLFARYQIIFKVCITMNSIIFLLFVNKDFQAVLRGPSRHFWRCQSKRSVSGSVLEPVRALLGSTRVIPTVLGSLQPRALISPQTKLFLPQIFASSQNPFIAFRYVHQNCTFLLSFLLCEIQSCFCLPRVSTFLKNSNARKAASVEALGMC